MAFRRFCFKDPPPAPSFSKKHKTVESFYDSTSYFSLTTSPVLKSAPGRIS